VNVADVYGALGLDPGADGDEVKAAFRFLSKKYHPDRCADPQAGRRFVRIVKAYKFLSQPSRKDALLQSKVRDRLQDPAADSDVFSLGSLAVSASDPELRRRAARRLGFTGKKAAYVFLRRSLSDKDEAVVEAAVRSIADLSVFQAAGEIAALYARAERRVRQSILDAAESTGEPLFRSALDYAIRNGGLEGLRARKILSEAGAARRAGA